MANSQRANTTSSPASTATPSAPQREPGSKPIDATKFGSGSEPIPLIVLAVLVSIAAMYWLKPILAPIAISLLLACVLSPLTKMIRRFLRLGPMGAAVVLFLMLATLGLYIASLTAEGLIQAAIRLPTDIEWTVGKISGRYASFYREMPRLNGILPDPGTIDQLGKTPASLFAGFQNYLVDLTGWVVQGLLILTLVLFLLAEGDMLAPKMVRYFLPIRRDADESQQVLRRLIHPIRTFLIARTLINIVLGTVLALGLWFLNVQFAFVIGGIVALLTYIPYIGPVLGGILPVLACFAQGGTMGDVLIVTALYLAIHTTESYVATPMIMGRSLDLNGSTVLIACMFWGFLWGIVGLILAMPITAAMKVIFEAIPSLNCWADLMSQTPNRPNSSNDPSNSSALMPITIPTITLGDEKVADESTRTVSREAGDSRELKKAPASPTPSPSAATQTA